MSAMRRKTKKSMAVLFAGLVFIAGCGGSVGGGGDGGGGSAGGGSDLGGIFGAGIIDDGKEFGGNPQSSTSYRNSITPDEAYHLLRSAAFGATPKQVDDAVKKGLAETVDALLRKSVVPSTVRTLAESYELDMPKRWLVHMIDGPNPLHEKMAMFWHDRFATSRRVLGGRDRNLAVLHWNMLRDNALGDYRVFLEELTIDPLMLIWLDGANSPKASPNENYTREFWELFTLGRDSLYTEEDIREGARAFTGITLFREQDLDARPIFDLLNHDETIKTIFPGRTAPENFDYLKVIDLTLEQAESSRYVARNLFSYFAHDKPSDALVSDLANTLVEANFQITPLVRRILRSQAMFSEEARGDRIMAPVEHIVGVARTLDMHIHSEESQTSGLDRLVRDLREGGQELLNPPGVEGWGENEYWLQDQWVLSRARALSRSMDFGPQRVRDLPYHLLPSVTRWTEREVREEIVDAMASVFHLQLTDEERDVFVEVLDQNGWRAFHLTEPEQQPRHVAEMIRLMAMSERVLTR